jgi:hypothetical protein
VDDRLGQVENRLIGIEDRLTGFEGSPGKPQSEP